MNATDNYIISHFRVFAFSSLTLSKWCLMFVQPIVITTIEGGTGTAKLRKFRYLFLEENVPSSKVADDQTILHATADNSPACGGC